MSSLPLQCFFVQYNKNFVIQHHDAYHFFLDAEDAHKLQQCSSLNRKAEIVIRKTATKAFLQLLSGTAHHPLNGNTIVIDGKQYWLSLSHTDNAVAISISEKPHGIDIESTIRHAVYRNKIVKRYFSIGEQQFVNRSLLHKTKRFISLWTIKEAIAKLKGLSLAQALQYDTILNADGLFLSNVTLLKNYHCGLAFGDSSCDELSVTMYTADERDILHVLCRCGRYRIRTSDLLHVRQAL